MGNDAHRTALVAGVGETLGAALARRFHAEGFAVGLLARSEFVADLAADLGDRALAVRADLTDPEAVAGAVEAVRAAFGPVDVFVHNASAPGGHPLAAATPDSFRSVWETRAFGAFLCLRELTAPDAVVFSGTNYASDGAPGQVEWGSAAAATKGLARSVAGDGFDGATVVYIEVATAVAPAGEGAPWAADAADVAGTYVDLLDRPPGFHTHRIA